MKKILLTAASSLALFLQFGATTEALAWKPRAPFCVINCGIPLARISASPAVVALPSYTVTGNTRLTWSWDFQFGPASFDLACIYVRVNSDAHYSKVTCEYPGNTNTYDVPWIVAGNVYTFVVARNGQNIQPIHSLAQLVSAHNGSSSVTVTGVVQ